MSYIQQCVDGLFARVQQWAREEGLQPAAVVRPPASREQVQAFEAALGIEHEFAELHLTHDGTQVPIGTCRFRLLSLDEIARLHPHLVGKPIQVEFDGGWTEAWRRRWVPMAQDPSGDLLVYGMRPKVWESLTEHEQNDLVLGSTGIVLHEERRIQLHHDVNLLDWFVREGF